MRIWIIIMLLHFTNLLNAQKLSGTVSSENKDGISYATIKVLNTTKGAVADSLGNFQIELPVGKYELFASAIGFASKIILVEINENQSKTIEIILQQQVNSLDEVVITANKYEQTLLESSICLTHISSEKISDTRTWKLEDLRALVPNYQYADFGVSYQQMQAIRGISVFSENPSVATYIDGVNALDVSSNGLQLIDIERIEVLRGPQGTLYGRNAMGGVINIITKQPTSKTSGFIETSIGNQGLQRYAVGIKVPLVKDKLFAGFTGQYQKQFGFYTNDLSDKMSFDGNSLKGTVEDGQRMGDESSYYGNLFLKWIGSNRFKVVLNFKTQRDQSLGASMYYQAVENEVTAINDPFKMAVNSLGSNSRFLLNTSLSATYYHPKVVITSVTAHQYVLQKYINIDQDLFPYALATGSTYNEKVGDPMPQNVLSQEFRFTAPSNISKFYWTSGFYFFNQQYEKRFAAQYEKLALLFGEQPGTQITQNDENNTGAAVFGQVNYKFNTHWNITIGLRYDFESRSSLVARFRLDSLNEREYTLPENKRTASFHALSPKAVLSYHFNPNNHIFGSYSRGFRAGGINNSSKVAGYETYQPEYSDNIEFGYKWISKTARISLQSALFFLNWKDLQLDLRTDGGVYVIQNIGNVRSTGLEIEVLSKPVKNLQLDASFGFNHSRYQDFEFLEQNIKGNNTILAPIVTQFLGVQYQINLLKDLQMTLRGEWRLIGKQYFDLINTISQPSYSIFNTRTEFNYKYLNVGFWVQNISNKTFIAYAMPGYFRYTILNRPRTLGITLTAKF